MRNQGIAKEDLMTFLALHRPLKRTDLKRDYFLMKKRSLGAEKA